MSYNHLFSSVADWDRVIEAARIRKASSTNQEDYDSSFLDRVQWSAEIIMYDITTYHRLSNRVAVNVH